MNGIVALCHFCELHGPSVLFCTQAFRALPASDASHGASAIPAEPAVPAPALAASLPSAPPSFGVSPPAGVPSSLTGETPTMKAPLSRRMDAAPPGSVAAQATSPPAAAPDCPSCSSLPDRDYGLVSYDDEALTAYLSTRAPVHNALASVVRHACIRSLSCEMAPGREGPVLFGDESSGYVFSYIFQVKDAQARGMQRSYCFSFVLTDRIYLVASWPFLVNTFRTIATMVQHRAEQTFERDVAQNTRHTPGGGPPMMPDHFGPRRRAAQSLRSLVDLVGSKSFFSVLHGYTSWVLKAWANRLFERQIVGPPPLASRVPGTETISIDRVLHDVATGRWTAPETATVGSLPASHAFWYRHMAREREEGFPQVQIHSLLELARVLSPEDMTTLVANAVIGNQIIVRGDVFVLVASVLRALRDLLPSGCVTVAFFEERYLDAWQCNFLGLPSNVEVPAHVDRHTYALLDIRYDAFDERPLPSADISAEPAADIDDKLASFYFALNHGPRPQSLSILRTLATAPSLVAPPPLAQAHAAALGDVLAGAITNTFTQQLDSLLASRPTPETFDLALSVLKEEWMSTTKLFFRLTRSEDGENDDRLRKFLRVMGLKDADVPLLRFWTSGLSRQYRALLLQQH